MAAEFEPRTRSTWLTTQRYFDSPLTSTVWSSMGGPTEPEMPSIYRFTKQNSFGISTIVSQLIAMQISRRSMWGHYLDHQQLSMTTR